MSQTIEVKVPDIGDFKDVAVIEVFVKAGDKVEAEQSLITLETDKAAMEVPSPAAGSVKALKVRVGDKVSEGSVILTMESKAQTSTPPNLPLSGEEPTPPLTRGGREGFIPQPSASSPQSLKKGDLHAEVLVLGAGPGGYTAAFRAADLGKQVVLGGRPASLGGGWRNGGALPSND